MFGRPIENTSAPGPRAKLPGRFWAGPCRNLMRNLILPGAGFGPVLAGTLMRTDRNSSPKVPGPSLRPGQFWTGFWSVGFWPKPAQNRPKTGPKPAQTDRASGQNRPQNRPREPGSWTGGTVKQPSGLELALEVLLGRAGRVVPVTGLAGPV